MVEQIERLLQVDLEMIQRWQWVACTRLQLVLKSISAMNLFSPVLVRILFRVMVE